MQLSVLLRTSYFGICANLSETGTSVCVLRYSDDKYPRSQIGFGNDRNFKILLSDDATDSFGLICLSYKNKYNV